MSSCKVFTQYGGSVDDDLVIRNEGCVVCGLLGSLTCSGCKGPRYCCKDHQVLHWDYHKGYCKFNQGSEVGSFRSPLFKEFIIETDVEDFEEMVLMENTKNLQIKSVVPTSLNNMVYTSDANQWRDEEYENSVNVDKAFLKFQKRLKYNPDQVLRYVRNIEGFSGDPNELVLWVSDKDKLTNIPSCKTCGSQLKFEFQVMPQILNYIITDNKDPNSLDFGTLVIYSCDNPGCVKLCKQQGLFREEYLYRQDFSQEGLGYDHKKKTHGLK